MKILTLKKSELKEINWIEEINEYLVIQKNGNPLLVSSLCKHNKLKLPRLKDGEKCVTCPAHGWVLNIQKSEYENPIGIKQLSSRYKITVKEKSFEIYEDIKNKDNFFWNDDKKRDLIKNEFKVEFVNHACLIIKTPKINLVTDPWIISTAFSTGWFLKFKTNKNYINEILNSKYVYVSHSHPDHLNPISLLWLRSKGWDPVFIIPKYERKDLTKPAISALGFSKIIELVHKETFQFKEDNNASIQMVMDLTERNDSGILFNYKGNRILNLVDCASPDIEDLNNVDVSLIDFANGASGYPVCWDRQYSLKEISSIKQVSNLNTINKFYSKSKQIDSHIVIPFAGYFSIPLKEDDFIRNINIQNTTDNLIRKRPSNLRSKIVEPFYQHYEFLNKNSITIDFKNQKEDENEENWNEKYRDCMIERYADIKSEELKEFLSIQNFKDELIVNFNVFNVEFNEKFWNLSWDFFNNHEITAGEKSGYRNLNINVRAYSLGYTLRNSLPWEEFSIGFQARFSRVPDVYNFYFWDYFQNGYSILKPIYGDLIDFWYESNKIQSIFNKGFSEYNI